MMKKIVFIFALVFVCMFSFALVSCKPEQDPPVTDDTEKEEPKNDHTTGEFVITFVMASKQITQRYDMGEEIDPPTFEPLNYGNYSIYFDGWQEPFVPVTGDKTYIAKYYYEYTKYTTTFIMGDKTVEVKTDYSMPPEVPEVENYNGMSFLCWDKEPSAIYDETTYTAIYYDPSFIDEKGFRAALKADLLQYASTEGNDSGARYLRMAMSAYTLALHEYRNPQGGIVACRVVEHLTSIVSKDKAPPLDASTNWAYNPLTACIATVRVTPTIWDNIPADVKLRLDTMMCAYIYLGSFATSDYNDYRTGPGMYGNYRKTWNPNYRLGNIPEMVYACYYFGAGDMEAGADMANKLIKAFDEDVYTNLVNSFQKYGWRRAFKRWTAEARTSTDGKNVEGESAKTLLCYGGQAVGEDTSTSSDLLVALGSGTGVANLDPKTKKGRDYMYQGFTLYEYEHIIRHLINYNYGGTMKTGSSAGTSYKIVMSDHWYDTNKDGTKELLAYIADGTISPYEGKEGMMTEFASGDRSSTGYCTHDFILTTALLTWARTMQTYTTDEDGHRVLNLDENGTPAVIFDLTTDEKFFHRVQIGNEDLIYKLIHGYQCYATGSYGTSQKLEYETGSADYVMAKSIWRTFILPLGTVQTAESYSS